MSVADRLKTLMFRFQYILVGNEITLKDKYDKLFCKLLLLINNLQCTYRLIQLLPNDKTNTHSLSFLPVSLLLSLPISHSFFARNVLISHLKNFSSSY